MSEDAFLQELFRRLGKAPDDLAVPPGDDCAAIRLPDGRLLLLAVDQIVGNRHYIEGGAEQTAPELAGRKLLARNLSDIAAMGGKPTTCLVALSFGSAADETWMNRFFDGLLALANEFRVSMIGGDLARTDGPTVASLTILGTVAETQVLRRSGARPGDLLFATGTFGRSFPTGHHLTFQPRCAEGAWLAASGTVSAAIDVSDGLVLDARRICRASGTGLILDADSIPRRTPQTTLLEALEDGEDYELLMAVPPGRSADKLQAEWPFPAVPLTAIGHFTATDEGPAVRDVAGHALTGTGGYDHLARSN